MASDPDSEKLTENWIVSGDHPSSLESFQFLFQFNQDFINVVSSHCPCTVVTMAAASEWVIPIHSLIIIQLSSGSNGVLCHFPFVEAVPRVHQWDEFTFDFSREDLIFSINWGKPK